MHEPWDDREFVRWRRMLRFAREPGDPFDRLNPDRHFVASAIVTSSDFGEVLLMRHRRLGLWLQFGGHAEAGDASPRAVAERELLEESGLNGATVAAHGAGVLDLDIHMIPRHGNEPPHEHYDLRYAYVAEPGVPLARQVGEVKELRWFKMQETRAMPLDAGLARALAKLGPATSM